MINTTLQIVLLAGLLISGVTSQTSLFMEPVATTCDRCSGTEPSLEEHTVKGSLILRMGPGPCTIAQDKFDKGAAETYIKKCIKDPAPIIKL